MAERTGGGGRRGGEVGSVMFYAKSVMIWI